MYVCMYVYIYIYTPVSSLSCSASVQSTHAYTLNAYTVKEELQARLEAYLLLPSSTASLSKRMRTRLKRH